MSLSRVMNNAKTNKSSEKRMNVVRLARGCCASPQDGLLQKRNETLNKDGNVSQQLIFSRDFS